MYITLVLYIHNVELHLRILYKIINDIRIYIYIRLLYKTTTIIVLILQVYYKCSYTNSCRTK